MFDRIAVPLDGSEIAFPALGPGRRLAHVHGARLVLVTVATPETGGITGARHLGRRQAHSGHRPRHLDHRSRQCGERTRRVRRRSPRDADVHDHQGSRSATTETARRGRARSRATHPTPSCSSARAATLTSTPRSIRSSCASTEPMQPRSSCRGQPVGDKPPTQVCCSCTSCTRSRPEERGPTVAATHRTAGLPDTTLHTGQSRAPERPTRHHPGRRPRRGNS